SNSIRLYITISAEKLILSGIFSKSLYLPETRMSIILLGYKHNEQYCDQIVTIPKILTTSLLSVGSNLSKALRHGMIPVSEKYFGLAEVLFGYISHCVYKKI